jgi:subtilase family serine protease
MIFVCARGQLCAAGGTSASSPFWAGLGALLQQDLLKRKLGALSPFNDRLATLGPSAKAGTFRHPQFAFNAVAIATKGRDAVTGWGAPDAVLLDAELRRVVAAR